MDESISCPHRPENALNNWVSLYLSISNNNCLLNILVTVLSSIFSIEYFHLQISHFCWSWQGSGLLDLPFGLHSICKLIRKNNQAQIEYFFFAGLRHHYTFAFTFVSKYKKCCSWINFVICACDHTQLTYLFLFWNNSALTKLRIRIRAPGTSNTPSVVI